MRVGIITFHFVNNFGGALQAYALSEVVSSLTGQAADMIDYRHYFICFTDFIRLLPVTSNIKEISAGMKTLQKRVERLHKFKQFQKTYYHETKTYYSSRGLKTHLPKYDVYICGSDQIWNPIVTLGVAKPYYLRFVKEGRKIAYGASFGVSELAKRYQKKIRAYLKDLDVVSVREDKAVQLVKTLADCDAVQVLDPTLLIQKKDWEMVAIPPKLEEPYILVYVMQQNDEVYAYAQRIKQLLQMKVVAISRYGYQPACVDEVIMDIGPREFVGLFQKASYVCTNSFHGLVFSIIFEKDFYVVPSKRFSARIESLLRVLEIPITDEITEQTIKKPTYDRANVKAVLERERQKSLRFLKEALTEESNK